MIRCRLERHQILSPKTGGTCNTFRLPARIYSVSNSRYAQDGELQKHMAPACNMVFATSNWKSETMNNLSYRTC